MTHPSPLGADAFKTLVGNLSTHQALELSEFFGPHEPIIMARAPGRLDVMGGIADYSGALVLQLPLAEATYAAVQLSEDPHFRIISLNQDDDGFRAIDYPHELLGRLVKEGYEASNQRLNAASHQSWGSYVIGTLIVLARECQVSIPQGLRILVHSQVPEGKGVSSSAAIEVATMKALGRLLGLDLEDQRIATLCQVVENRVVGAPCGIMDQMTSALGRQNRLLALRCQPAHVEGFASIPNAIGFWGIDSGVRHFVSSADYASVRTGAFMGYRVLADHLGLEVSNLGSRVHIVDPRWQGYLANIQEDEFLDELLPHIPDQIGGQEFLDRYQGITDEVTEVDPQRLYSIQWPTRHPVEEQARVRRFQELLPKADDIRSRVEMGELMFASHQSYSRCGLGSPATDSIVDLVRKLGPESGLYGAKITGGGSGGTVAVLADARAHENIGLVVSRHIEAFGKGGRIFHGSSPGAMIL